MRMMNLKMKRFIYDEAQAGPDSDRIMKQNTARCLGRCREGQYIRDRKSPVPNMAGMRVKRMIILRRKSLPPWHVVEVHVIVAAMGRGRNLLPNRVG